MNAFGRFLKKRPRLLQALCPHRRSEYVGRFIPTGDGVGRKDERPVYRCSACGLYRLGEKSRTNPFEKKGADVWGERRGLRRRRYVTIPMNRMR